MTSRFAGLPLDRVLALSAGRCVPSRSALPNAVDPCTDTRVLRSGQVYVALLGERFDGHEFVAAARAAGAVAAIVSRTSALPDGFPGIVVQDTTRAYLACAQAARERFGGQVIAITGSVGKTTTKEFCRALCEAAGLGPVLATPANENNEIGVGHLMLRALRSEAFPPTLVVEMGARHAGEIEVLCGAARPDVGVLTGIGESHLENFPSLESLRETKWGLFAYGARPVLNAADAASLARVSRVLDRAPILCSAGSGTSPRTAAMTTLRNLHSDMQITQSDPTEMHDLHPGMQRTQIGKLQVSRADNGDAVEVRYRKPASNDEEIYRGTFPIPGAHHRLDLALALGAIAALGGDLAKAVDALPTLALPDGRYQAVELPSGASVIYDAYNAAPASTEAALQTFAEQAAQRRIAVLASMAELGSQAEELHRRVGTYAGRLANRRALDALLVGGDYAEALQEGALAGGAPPASVKRFDSNAEATEWLRGNLHPGDAVLLKGSRRYKMEEILEGLRR